WDLVQSAGWQLPLYWRERQGAAGNGAPGHGPAGHGAAGAFEQFTLQGWRPLDATAPVAHLSLFEADAFARWADARLPTEAEGEHAARQETVPHDAKLLERGALRPLPADGDGAGASGRVRQVWGDLWEWTSSAYGPYPGFRASADAVGEYNGKFMCNQY